MKLPIFVSISALAAIAISAQPIERVVDLAIEPGASSTLGISLSTGGSDEKMSLYSGNALARVEFDEETLEVTGFTFTGGQVYRTDASLSVVSPIIYTGQGTFSTIVSVSFHSLGYQPRTTLFEGSVQPETGRLENSQHYDFYNKGEAFLSLTAQGETFSQAENFQQTPLIVPWTGESTIRLEEVPTDKGLLQRSLRARFSYSINDSEPERIDGTNATLTTTEVGSFVASATLTLESPFSEWATANGLALVTGEERNPSGHPYYLLFALGADPFSHALPIWIQVDGQPLLIIQLPDSGLKAPLAVEASSSLASGSWMAVSPDAFVPGFASLEVGSAGQVKVKLPANGRGFLRLAAVIQGKT